MIIDKNQFDKFIAILPELEKDQVYFVSLSARNKYLTDEERRFYGLGRTEMFARTLVRSKGDFEFAMKKLQAELGYKTTKNGKPIPKKAIVTYININPSSMVDAYNLFKKESDHELAEMIKAYMNGKQPNFDGFKRLDRKLLNCVQKSKGNRYFLDIDFDIPREKWLLMGELTSVLDLYNVSNYAIKTKSGYHVLINREHLTKRGKDIQLHKLIKNFNEEVKDKDIGEVVFNDNQMVAIPGTMQSDHLVTML